MHELAITESVVEVIAERAAHFIASRIRGIRGDNHSICSIYAQIRDIMKALNPFTGEFYREAPHMSRLTREMFRLMEGRPAPCMSSNPRLRRRQRSSEIGCRSRPIRSAVDEAVRLVGQVVQRVLNHEDVTASRLSSP